MDSKRIAAARSRVYIIVPTIAALLDTVSATGLMPEYTAAEARKHIGENATVVGKVDCIGHGRRHVDVIIGGCGLRKALLWIVVPDEASGPELDPEQIRNVTVAVTGKIESSMGTPQITVKSTTQIQARSALQTNYIGRAYDKETKGDLDGAIEDLNQAIEHQPARRDEACEHLARVKEKRGDWPGALATYDRLVELDPNKSASYYVRATAKKQHGDFEGAMTDFTHAAELRSSGINLVEIGNMRKANGDSTGAMAEYNKAIAMLDSQIAGVEKPSDRLDLLYYHRGYAKELKGDVDGAVADYSQAIATKPSYGAGAYSRRGDIKKARGDLAGAIADYQYAVKYAQLNEDKEKLNKAKAEAKTRTKNVAIQPNIQATQNEQSLNKSEVSPESIVEAFIQAYSGADVDALAGLYADRVDHTNSGVISNAAVRAQAKEYFARWPVRQWSLVGPVKTISLGATKQKVIFSASYDASDPKINKHALGIAQETLILASDKSGAIKIVSQKEQTSKRSSGQSGESGKETSEDTNFEAAKAEYEASSQDEAARVRYVTKLAEMDAQLTPKILHNPDVVAKEAYANQAGAIGQELRKHPLPRNVDSRKLSQLLIGEWDSPRHTYVFRSDGTYGVGDEQRDKWRIDGNEYIDDVSRGPIILLDRNHFIYADGRGVTTYERANSTSSGNGDKPADSAIKQASSAEVIDVPAAQADLGIKAGNIKVTFADGHAETATKNGNCMQPHVSAKGDVGWIHCTGFDHKGYALNEKVIIRLSSGAMKEFRPDTKVPFIVAWAFTNDGSGVVIQSMSFHGPSSYIRYDMASRKVTNKKDGHDDSEPLPRWAQPLSN